MLGRLTAAPRITHAESNPPPREAPPPIPETLQRLRIPEGAPLHAVPEQQTGSPGSSSATAESLDDPQRFSEPAPTAAPSAPPSAGKVEAVASLGPSGTGSGEGAEPPEKAEHQTSGATATSAPSSEESTFSPVIAMEQREAIGVPLAGFIGEVLHGSLRDERLAPGSPRGWIFEDKRGEFLVPWGFLRDWAFKTRRRFTDMEAAWTRDGMVRGRASVTVNGRSITCLLFSKSAALRLPGQLQRLVAQSFVKVPPTEVHPSPARGGT